MTSTWHDLLTTLYRAALAAVLLAAFSTTASARKDRGLLAADVVIEEPASAPVPQTPPPEDQTPQQSDQPGERKRTYDGPPKDELLPNGRRLSA